MPTVRACCGYTISPQRSAARNVHQRRTLLGVAAGLAAAYSRPTIDTTSHRVGARLAIHHSGLIPLGWQSCAIKSCCCRPLSGVKQRSNGSLVTVVTTTSGVDHVTDNIEGSKVKCGTSVSQYCRDVFRGGALIGAGGS